MRFWLVILGISLLLVVPTILKRFKEREVFYVDDVGQTAAFSKTLGSSLDSSNKTSQFAPQLASQPDYATVWCSKCQAIEELFRINGLEYRWDYVKRDSSEWNSISSSGKTIVSSHYQPGLPVIRVKLKQNKGIKSSPRSICQKVAIAINNAQISGGCLINNNDNQVRARLGNHQPLSELIK
jgi:hypothetical protein